MLAITASAADVYLVGSEFGWGANADYQFTANPDGKYVLNMTQDLAGQIKIISVDGTNTTWYGYTGNVNENGTYTLNSQDNLGITGICQNATLTWDDTTHQLTINGTWAQNDYNTVYLVGQIDGADWNTDVTTYPLTLKEGTENVWEGSYSFTSSVSRFKLKAGHNIFGTGGQDINVVLGQEYTASLSGDAFCVGEGDYTFTYVLDKNAEEGTLTVTGQVVYPETLYLATDADGDWTAATAFTKESNGIYTLKNVALNSNFFFTSIHQDPITDWDPVDANHYGPIVATAPAVGRLFDLAPNSNSFHYTNTSNLKFDVTVNLNTNKAEFALAEGSELTPATGPEHVYVLGTVEGQEWSSDNPFELTKMENTPAGNADFGGEITLIDNKGQCAFAIVTTKNSNWDIVNGQRYYHPGNLDSMISTDLAPNEREHINLDGPADAQSDITPGKYYIHVYFTPVTGNVPAYMTLKKIVEGDPTSVEGIEADNDVEAIYYNLQGIRVAEPTNGLYIRVKGDKVDKVIIRK